MSAKKRSAAAPAETAAAAVEAPPAPAPAAKAEPAKQQPSAAAKSRIAALTGPQKAAAVVVSLGRIRRPSSISTWTPRTWKR